MIRPYYQDGDVTLWHGDAFSRLAALPAGAVDLTVTDPPYNEVNRPNQGLRDLHKGQADSASVDSTRLVRELDRVTSGAIYLWCGYRQLSQIVTAFDKLGRATRVGVWEKTNPSPMNGEKMWVSGTELCVFAHGANAYFSRHCEVAVWSGPTERRTDHPTPKPLWLFYELLRASSRPGDTVLDPFVGSGTTLRAAKDLGRRAVGVEIDERYCEVAARRLAQGVLDLGVTA